MMTREKMDALMKRYCCDTLEALVECLANDVEAYREDVKEMQRDHREALAEAARVERQAAAGEPYGTY